MIDIAGVMEEGIINPVTLAGMVVVDGVAASVYTDMLGSEARLHAFCAWARALWRLAPWVPRALHRAGWAQAVALGASLAARAVV